MSDDLVQRLRADVFYGDARLANMDKHNPLHMEAADRIEALEAALKQVERETVERIVHDLGMTLLTNIEAPSEWIDGFETALKRVQRGEWK